jgi:hypothetical protein
MFRNFFLCSFILLFAGYAFEQLAAGKEPAEKTKAEVIQEDIKQALNEPTVIECNEMALADIVDYLKDYHKQLHPNFGMLLDTKPLSDLGITPETTITKNLKGISLRAALRLILRDLGLSYTIQNETLLITSPDEACYTKVYDVADLVAVKQGESNDAPLDSLLKMVDKTCSAAGNSVPAGWIASQKSAEVAAIVVHQPEETQDAVADLLAQLRAAKHPK